jgi:hypothetical protein
MGKAESRLRQQGQQIGQRALQINLDHAIGHHPDLVDRGKVEAQRRSAQGGQRAPQRSGDIFGIDPGAIGPGAVAQAEDIALAIVGHDPAIGQPRHHPPFGVKPHQPFHRGGAQCLPGESRTPCALNASESPTRPSCSAPSPRQPHPDAEAARAMARARRERRGISIPT